MKHAPTTHDESNAIATPGNRRLRVSAMRLLAAGALCAALPATAADVTNLAEFSAALNNPFDENIVVTGGDIDLLGQGFTLTVTYTQFFGDVAPRTISNGTITVAGSTSDANFNLLNIATDAIFTGDVVLNPFSRLNVFGTDSLGLGASVEADDNTDIQLYTFAGDSVTWDQTFFNKFTVEMDADPELISFSFVGPGNSIITGLPIFGAELRLDQFAEFEFATAPQTDPTATLGATLAGNHDFVVAFGTLDLNDFDLTIDSLTGSVGTAVTLGTGTLTTGDEQDTTYAGVISGTGNLVKTGIGVFTLTGVNTYTGTTTVTAGTLALEADQTGHTAVVVQNGGILLVNVDQTGTPTYSIENGGIVNLNADLVDTTDVTIDVGGLLNINTDQTLATIMGGGTVSLVDSNLTIGDATNPTFAGVISGDGDLTKVGAGNLTLSGINTFTGMTTLSEGTLTLDGSLTGTSAVSIAAGTTLVLNGDIRDAAPITLAAGATLDLNDTNETLNRVTGTGDITLGTGMLTLGNSSSYTFDGTISETGDLIKAGAGTLTLSGAQTYTGSTTINAGTLIANGDMATSDVTVTDGTTFNLESTLTAAGSDVVVDDGGTFFGTATIGDDLTNNGLVTFIGPGAGDTINVGGDYTQGATGTLRVQLGNAGGLVVAGTANLDGTLDITTPADPANFDINATYDVISAGATAGNFATVTDNFAFLDLTSNNVGGDVEVTLARNAVALASIARTTNQTTIANVLDGMGAPVGNLEDAIDRILASSETGALATYDQLAGGGAATASTQIAASAVNQSHRVLDQVIGVAPGTSRPTGAFSQAPRGNDLDEADHLTLLSFYQGTVEEEDDQEYKTTIAGLNPTPWASFYGGFGDQGDGAEGLEYTRYGLLIGLELESDETAALYGLSLGIEQSDFDFNQSNGDVDITSLYLSGYTRQPFGNNYHFTLSGGFGFHTHDSSRSILIGVTPTQANADFDSTSISVAAELSKTFDITRTHVDPGTHPTLTSIEPFARLDYSISMQDGYSETGAGAAGLNVSSNDFDSVRAAFGVRAQHQYMFMNQYEAVFQARALVNTAISNSDSDLNVSFVGAPGTGFAIEGSDQDDIYGQIGLGFSVQLDGNWDLHLSVDQQFSSDAMGTVLAGGLSYEF